MAIKNIFSLTRPSTSVDFPEISAKFRKIAIDYDLDGKRKFESNIISADGLKQTIVTIFDSESSRFDWVENSTIQAELNTRDVYCIENNITISQSTEDI